MPVSDVNNYVLPTVGLSGASEIATETSPFSITTSGYTVSGTLATTVWSGDANNPLSGLTFEYKISVDGNSTDSLQSSTINGWLDSYNMAGALQGGQAPTSVMRPGSPFGKINVNWGGYIKKGQTADLLFYSDLTSYTGSTATVQDGGSQSGLNTYAPVPEPTTLVAGMLLLLPFGASTLRTLRKNRAA